MACPPKALNDLRDGSLDWHRREREVLGVSFTRRLVDGETLTGQVEVEYWEQLTSGWVDRSELWVAPNAQILPSSQDVAWVTEKAEDQEAPSGGRRFALGVTVQTSNNRRLFAHPRLRILDAASGAT